MVRLALSLTYLLICSATASAAEPAAGGTTDPQFDRFLAVAGALSQLVILSMVLERGLAFIYEHEWFRSVFTRQAPDPTDPTKTKWETKIPGLRATIALGASLLICLVYKFDVLAAVFSQPSGNLGMILTAVVAAGGSAGAIALFQGFLGFSKEARDASVAARKEEAQASVEVAKAQAEAKKTTAEAERIAAEAAKATADARKKQAEFDTARVDQERRAAGIGGNPV